MKIKEIQNMGFSPVIFVWSDDRGQKVGVYYLHSTSRGTPRVYASKTYNGQDFTEPVALEMVK